MHIHSTEFKIPLWQICVLQTVQVLRMHFLLKDDFSFFFTSKLNAGYDTLAYLKYIFGTASTQSGLFTS